jgi:hypothetical protein
MRIGITGRETAEQDLHCTGHAMERRQPLQGFDKLKSGIGNRPV